MPGSQASIARVYGTSVTTLTKCAKQIEEALQLEGNDLRYAIAPDELAYGMPALRRALGIRGRIPFKAGRGKSWFR